MQKLRSIFLWVTQVHRRDTSVICQKNGRYFVGMDVKVLKILPIFSQEGKEIKNSSSRGGEEAYSIGLTNIQLRVGHMCDDNVLKRAPMRTQEQSPKERTRTEDQLTKTVTLKILKHRLQRKHLFIFILERKVRQ